MKRLICVILVCAAALLCGCQAECRETVFAMDTVMDLQVWGADSQEAVSAVKALILDMEKTWSAQKLTEMLGDLDRALDRILALQETYLGGVQ